MKRILLLLASMVLLLPLKARDDYSYRNLTMNDGLLSNSVRNIVQDPYGFISAPTEVGSQPPIAEIRDGVVYILTNPAFKTFYIKIGYTANIDDRLRELYNTSVPLPFKVYALLKTNKYKQAEKMIHSAFKASRIGDDREFFMLKPDEALEQMKVVAEGLEAIVIQYDEKGKVKKTFDYSKRN